MGGIFAMKNYLNNDLIDMDNKDLYEQIANNNGWYYAGSGLCHNLSGWKLHIFGNDPYDSLYLVKHLTDVLIKYELHMKVASLYNFAAGIGNETHKQYGKCGTIYLHHKIFADNKLVPLIRELQVALSLYNNTGNITGDKSIDGKIHYRYELSTIIDPTIGISFVNYDRYYESNRGAYNINGNKDPF